MKKVDQNNDVSMLNQEPKLNKVLANSNTKIENSSSAAEIKSPKIITVGTGYSSPESQIQMLIGKKSNLRPIA